MQKNVKILLRFDKNLAKFDKGQVPTLPKPRPRRTSKGTWTEAAKTGPAHLDCSPDARSMPGAGGASATTPSLFPRLVLGWINADFRVQIRIFQHFSSSTRKSSSRKQICKILQNFTEFCKIFEIFRKFAEFLQNFAISCRF